MTKRKPNKGEEVQTNTFTIVHKDDNSLIPILAAGSGKSSITPPSRGGDKTERDRQRYKERQKGKLKGKMGDIIGDNPIITRPGKINVPVPPESEPIWRPGRDSSGQGKGGKKAGEGAGDYVEMDFEEFLEMFFESIGLPNMLKKMFAQTLVKTHKRRGLTNNGPKARMNKRASAVARFKRASALKNARPEDFVPEFAEKCQSVFEAYAFWAYSKSGAEVMFPEPVMVLIDNEVKDFLRAVENGNEADPLLDEDVETFRKEVLESIVTYLKGVEEGSVAPYTVHAGLQSRIESYVFIKERDGEIIPSTLEVPFHKNDLRFNRIEEKDDPDSKAMVELILDRSGSMGGDPIIIAKAYFFICVLFLKTKYKEVAIVMISHDGQEYLWKTEEEFFKIGASGGTVAVPAWELAYNIAEFGAKSKTTGNSAGPFPAAAWNRYMFHATDGDLFDGEQAIRDWFTKIVKAPFNYVGYLECGTSWGGGRRGWSMGGEALMGLPADVKAHVGMARASSLQDVPEAFKQILDKDRQKGA
ncbi:MAG: DUF444 family protein [Cyanobacteria bacterium SZAS LIN-3]|nr:DUF444 family protein [Cyanobacteria bacterium SZAS LIN-3]MBS2010721.1 DUF444 family protein [Cyanobacteria bacterium SZAS TMP-1]